MSWSTSSTAAISRFTLSLDTLGSSYAIHRSAWRNCLENRDSLQFAAPSVGNGGREAPFRSPVPSNIPYRETRQLFSKQFRKGNSPKYVPQQQRRFRTGLRCLRYSLCI